MKSEYNTLEFDYDRIREIKLKMNKEKQEKEQKETKSIINKTKINLKKPKLKLNYVKDELVEIINSKELLELMRVYHSSSWKNIGTIGDYKKESKFKYDYPLLTNIGILDDKINQFKVISHLAYTVSKTPFSKNTSDFEHYLIIDLKTFYENQNITPEEIKKINNYYEYKNKQTKIKK